MSVPHPHFVLFKIIPHLFTNATNKVYISNQMNEHSLFKGPKLHDCNYYSKLVVLKRLLMFTLQSEDEQVCTFTINYEICAK